MSIESAGSMGANPQLPPQRASSAASTGGFSPTRTYFIILGILAVLYVIFYSINQYSISNELAEARINALVTNPTLKGFQPVAVPQSQPAYWPENLTLICLGVTAVFGFMEYVVLKLLGLMRVGAIVRVTYYEALLQPFSLILLVLAWTLLAVFYFLPYYTLSEDAKMYRDVAMSFVLLFPMILMVFACGKVVDEEIENRTMLTLMSKPVARWQVILGKYLGVVCLMLAVVGALSVIAFVSSYMRYLDESRIDFLIAANTQETVRLLWEGHKALWALFPVSVLEFLQLCTLAAISIAISTRFGMAFNMTAIIAVYIIANLSRFLPTLDMSQPWKSLLVYTSYLLPNLSNFDLTPRQVYGQLRMGDDAWIKGVPSIGDVWQYVSLAALYGVMYIGAALSTAMALFRTRELT